MLHYMKLNSEPFKMISDGTKTIELRLYDEKRQKIRVGDFIEFSETDKSENKITVRVTAFHCYENFEELYKSLSAEKFGYKADETANPTDMEKYYSKQEQSLYGAMGIEFVRTDLQRFVDAQDKGYMMASGYEQAYKELENGTKLSHWIWYIFPQIKGLGMSEVSKHFSINDLEEAKNYIRHPVLGSRLINISEMLLDSEIEDAVEVFGYVDAQKLCSCMTLFREAAPDETVFQQMIDRFFNGQADKKTLEILN